MKEDVKNGCLIYLILLILSVTVCYIYINERMEENSSDYNYKSFEMDLENDNLKKIVISPNKQVPTGKVTVTLNNGAKYVFYVSDVSEIEDAYDESGSSAQYTMEDVNTVNIWYVIVPCFIVAGCIIALIMIMVSYMVQAILKDNNSEYKGGSVGPGSNSFIRSKAMLATLDDVKVRFKDVAGLDEEKFELEEIVDFLKNSKKYTELGARVPKGVLLVGPPGTGKTLLAKAVAGEADVPFLSISGSDFMELYVGVGAARVRELFQQARIQSPCIVFIDEIDAVGRMRGTGLGGGHDEREQTLNQLLVEMDGFSENEGIIVMAATNRVDILDPAILRPGRFDRKIAVTSPDVKGREGILEVHTRKKPLAEDVDLHEIARTTAGFSGADLENLMNEAAIFAARDSRKYINKADVDKAFIKVGIGTEKRSRVVPEQERKITAYHEAGHAILFHLLPDMGPVYMISAIPTGTSAAGYTMPLPENDNVFSTKNKMLQEIKVDFGGRIAEEMIFEDITTGASQDIKVATQMARSMVVKYGMSDKVGLINYELNEAEQVFIGRDLVNHKSYGANVADLIDKEVKRILDECYEDAKRILTENIDILHKCAALLIEKERINQAEFEALFQQKDDMTEL